MSMYLCAWCLGPRVWDLEPVEIREGIGPCGIGVIDNCEHSYGYWKLNPDPLEALLTTSHNLVFYISVTNLQYFKHSLDALVMGMRSAVASVTPKDDGAYVSHSVTFLFLFLVLLGHKRGALKDHAFRLLLLV